MSHYVVGYHDLQNNHYEICEYADDAYTAIEHSKEDVPFLKGHPHFIDKCTKEEEWKIYQLHQLVSPLQ